VKCRRSACTSNQNEENAAWQVNIESATFNAGARTMTVTYFLSDPTNNNARYNLVTSDCTGSGASVSCSSGTRFGNLRFYLAYQNMVGQSTAVTEFTLQQWWSGHGSRSGTNDGTKSTW
jgi:hypothetical protein